MDVAFKEGQSTTKIVVKNDKDEVILAAAKSCHASCAYEAKLLAIKFGLKSCADSGRANANIYSDSVQADNSVSLGRCFDWIVSHTFCDIQGVKSNMVTEALWIPREFYASACFYV